MSGNSSCHSCNFSGNLKLHLQYFLFKKKKKEKGSTWIEKIKKKGSTWLKGQGAKEAASTCFWNIVDKNRACQPTYVFTRLGGSGTQPGQRPPPVPQPTAQARGCRHTESGADPGTPASSPHGQKATPADAQDTSPFFTRVYRSSMFHN